VSFADKPSVPPAKKIGFALYFVAAFLVVSFLALNAAMGDCVSEGCLPDWVRLLMFPGSLVVALIGAFFVAQWAMKDEN
jgi:hypothetical protein